MEKVWFVLAALALSVSRGDAQPQIARQPQGATVLSGKPVSFSVEAVGSSPLRYQWSFNGQDLPGATQRVLTRLATPSRAGTYAVRIADTAGQVVSSAARLDVVNRPVFLVQPKNQIVAEHTVAEFRTVLNDSGPYRRMIWHNNNPIEGPHEIPPSTGYITDEPILRMTNPLNDVTWNSIYWLAVTNSAVGIVSRKARLTVVGPPVLSVQPQHRDVRPGSTVLFSVRVKPDAGPPETFQWYKDGAVLPGATAKTLIRRNVQAADQGNYYCVVSGMGGNTPSWGAFLTVGSAPP
jgi:hypothetical protein